MHQKHPQAKSAVSAAAGAVEDEAATTSVPPRAGRVAAASASPATTIRNARRFTAGPFDALRKQPS
jgi:hypothetical protein